MNMKYERDNDGQTIKIDEFIVQTRCLSALVETQTEKPNCNKVYHHQLTRSESLDKLKPGRIGTTYVKSPIRTNLRSGFLNVMFLSTCQKGNFTEGLTAKFNANKIKGRTPYKPTQIFSKAKTPKPTFNMPLTNKPTDYKPSVTATKKLDPDLLFSNAIKKNKRYEALDWPKNTEECYSLLHKIISTSIKHYLELKSELEKLIWSTYQPSNYTNDEFAAWINEKNIPHAHRTDTIMDVSDLDIPDIICINEINDEMFESIRETIDMNDYGVYRSPSDLNDLLMSLDPKYERSMTILIKINSQWVIANDGIISAKCWLGYEHIDDIYIRKVELNCGKINYAIGFVHLSNDLAKNHTLLADKALNDICEIYKIDELYGDFNQDNYFSYNKSQNFSGYYHTIKGLDEHLILEQLTHYDETDFSFTYQTKRTRENNTGYHSSSSNTARYIGRMIPKHKENCISRNPFVKLRPILGGPPIADDKVYSDHSIAFGCTSFYM